MNKYFIVSMELRYKKKYRTYNNIMMADDVYGCISKCIEYFINTFITDIIDIDKIRRFTTDQYRYWKRDSNKIYYHISIIPISSFKEQKQLLSDYEKYTHSFSTLSDNDMISYTESYDLYEIYFDNYGNHVSRFIIPYQGDYDFDMAYQVDLDNKFSTFDKFLKGDIVYWSKEPSCQYIIGTDIITDFKNGRVNIPTIVDIYPLKELGKVNKSGLPIFISDVHISELSPIRLATSEERELVNKIKI